MNFAGVNAIGREGVATLRLCGSELHAKVADIF
jgi:hypothetical protein